MNLKNERDPSSEKAPHAEDKSSQLAPASLRTRAFIVGAFLLLAIGIVFGQTLHHDFVNYDDDVYVYANPHVARGLTQQGFHWAFTHAYAGNWHPLTWVSHMLDCQLYGLHPGGHHLTSLLLHAATAILLFLLLLRMTGDFWPSAFVAVLFAIHPLRVESVAWVAERKDVLSGLFFVLTLGAYVEYVRRQFSTGWYAAVLGFFVLGLMAKPMLVTLPLVLLVLDIWPLGRLKPDAMLGQQTLRIAGASLPLRVIMEKLPLLLLVLISCVATLWAQQVAIVSFGYLPFPVRLGNALVSYVAYLGKFFYPLGLIAYYPHPGASLPVWQVIGALLILGGVTWAAVGLRRRYPYLLVGWLWYLIMLLPVIGLVQVGSQSMADRYTYLPSIGLAIAIVWFVDGISRSWHKRLPILAVASALVVIALSLAAWRQTSFWRNSETLWSHALACTPRNAVAHHNLGLWLESQGQVDEAIAHYRQALEISPTYVEVENNLGAVLLGRNQVDEAVMHFEHVLKIQPMIAQTQSNLGVALSRQGHFEEAISHYRKALEINPAYVEAEANLGSVLFERGQIDEAIMHYENVLNVQPGLAQVQNNLGVALVKKGRVEEAILHLRKALEIEPGNVAAHWALGDALASRGQLDEAVEHFRKGLRIQPNNAQAHSRLASALAARSQTAEAIRHYRRALEINPNFLDATNNLAWLLATCSDASFRDGAEAVRLARRAAELSGWAPGVLDTLAAAYAEAGDFGKAVNMASQALDLAVKQEQQRLVEPLRRRIELYEVGKPYHEIESLE